MEICGLRLKSDNLRRAAGCKMEAQCKGGVRNDVVVSIVAAGERRGLLGVGSRT